MVCISNPSVSQSADTSPYTGEALGWCDAKGEAKLYTDNPSVTAAPCHLSLHKGDFRRQATANLANSLLLLLRGESSLPPAGGNIPPAGGKSGKKPHEYRQKGLTYRLHLCYDVITSRRRAFFSCAFLAFWAVAFPARKSG